MYTSVLKTCSPLMYMRAIHSDDSCARDRVSRQIFGEWPGSATCTQPLSHWISCGQCSSSASEWLTEYPGQSATDSVSWWIRWGGDWLNPGSGEPWKGWSTSSYAIVDRPLDQWTNIQKTLQSTSSYTTNWPTLSNQRPPWANFNMRTNGDLFWPGQKEFWVIWGYSGSMV